MPREPRPWKCHAFGDDDPLSRLGDSNQIRYLRCYLHDLHVSCVLEEPYYFDRDYLAEFKAFYSTSVQGHPNTCRRLTFFSGAKLGDRVALEEQLRMARRGDPDALKVLNDGLEAFVVVRPIPGAALGRTVVREYPRREDAAPRQMVRRQYRLHLAGLQLTIRGLAWQQQDAGVGRCATIALWSMLHARSFDPRYAIPTTPRVTEAAHETASLGHRLYPSDGLRLEQLLEAIKELGLSPIVLPGDLQRRPEDDPPEDMHGEPLAVEDAFTASEFNSVCASLLRSRYPVMLLGTCGGERHAICVVGFRPADRKPVRGGDIAADDEAIDHLYVHDDNLGPNVRFVTEAFDFAGESALGLRPSAPEPLNPPRPVEDPTADRELFVPDTIVVAVDNEIRVDPSDIQFHGEPLAVMMAAVAKDFADKLNDDVPGFVHAVRFMRLTEYLGDELKNVIGAGVVLGETRAALCERVPPMSLHVAVLRLSCGDAVFVDVLYDTTDSPRNIHAFAHIVFGAQAEKVWDESIGPDGLGGYNAGLRVRAFPG